MKIEIHNHKNALVFKPIGSLDFHGIREFEERFQSESRNYKNFGVDMSEVRFIDSAGMSALVKILSFAKQRNGMLYLISITEDLSNLLEKSDLLFFFTTSTDREFNRKFPSLTDDLDLD